MTPAEIAEKFQYKPGFELVDFSEVALPVYRLSVEAITLQHRPIPPIKEFLLRGIEEGIESVKDLSAFLGIDEGLVMANLDQANEDRLVALDGYGERVVLLERGRQQLKAVIEMQPQDETLTIMFDGLRRRPVDVYGEPLFLPREIDARRTIEIRPYPAAPPEVADITIADVNRLLGKGAKGGAQGIDILKLKSIAKRVRLFRKGVALVFKRNRSTEFHFCFYVDDRADEELERVFAERAGPKKMGFIRALEASDDLSAVRRHLGPGMLVSLPAPDSLQESRRRVAENHAKLSNLVRRNDPMSPSRRESLEAAKAELDLARKELDGIPIRPLSPFEMDECLQVAFDRVRRGIILSTQAIWWRQMAPNIRKEFEAALRRGISIEIRMKPKKVGAERVLDVPEEIKNLQKRFPNLVVKEALRDRLFFLIVDDNYAVICNRPILGWSSAKKPFSLFSGFLLQEQSAVEAYLKRLRPSE